MSVRSSLSAGLAAAGLFTAAAGAAVMTPMAAPPSPAPVSAAVALSAVAAALPQPAAALPSIPGPFVGEPGTSPGDWIINGYNAIEPWIQYGVELGAWAVGWLPWPIGLAGAQLNISYSGLQPITQALVYSTAYLIDGQFDLIGPTITEGLQTGVKNFIQGEIAWFASFFPPLPPITFPVLPGAATVPAPTGRAEVLVADSARVAPSATEPVSETVADPASGPVAEPDSGPVSEVSGPVSELVTQPESPDDAAAALPAASVVSADATTAADIAPRVSRPALRAPRSVPAPTPAAAMPAEPTVEALVALPEPLPEPLSEALPDPAADPADPAGASKTAPAAALGATRATKAGRGTR